MFVPNAPDWCDPRYRAHALGMVRLDHVSRIQRPERVFRRAGVGARRRGYGIAGALQKLLGEAAHRQQNQPAVQLRRNDVSAIPAISMWRSFNCFWSGVLLRAA